MPEELMRFENVNIHALKNAPSVEGLNFTLYAGDLRTIVGKYPSDVATLWQFMQDDSRKYEYTGTIRVFQKPLRPSNSYNGEICFADSSRHLLNPFSVIDNIFLMEKEYYMRSKRQKMALYRALMDKFGLDLDPDARVDSISDENQMLIEMLRLYVRKPRICILHASLYILTDKTIRPAIEILTALRQECGAGILYCTTIYEDALKLSSHITTISNGIVTGNFSGDEARKNPKELLYCISGWTDLRKPDMVNLFSEAHNILESTAELRRVLEFLADSIVKVLDARSCYIYLLDESKQSIIDVGEVQEVYHDKLRVEFLCNYSNLQHTQVFVCHDVGFFESFRNQESAGTLQQYFLEPVFLKEEIIGFIQVNYERIQQDQEGKMRLLESFGREVGITVETSRLIGKSTLLQESHHRIKNNLQIIINLLYMNKYDQSLSSDPHVAEAFDALINQVKSIAVVHDMLSKDKLGKSITNLHRIIDEIVGFYHTEGIRFDLTLDNISIPYNKASTISLLVNELIANVTKHAFADGQDKLVQIVCTSNGRNLYLMVRDNGIGFPEQDKLVRGLGMGIITTSVSKMEGTVQFYNDHGAVVEINIPREGIYDIS